LTSLYTKNNQKQGTARAPIAAIAGDARFSPGAVTVSFDHRLNVFGFLALKELSEEQGGSSGNYGLMDQLEALRWVQVRSSSSVCAYV
jgi:carboxylesterase type B